MRTMRRFKQQLPQNEVIQILKTATNGTLALVDADGHPYGVPMSFVYDGDNSIYFHCALSGRKIDCIKNNPHCCFTLIDRDEIHPDEFTTYFRSVITEGKIKILINRDDIIRALRLLSSKYSPGLDCEPEISEGIDRVLILKMTMESITGKEAIELVKKRKV